VIDQKHIQPGFLRQKTHPSFEYGGCVGDGIEYEHNTPVNGPVLAAEPDDLLFLFIAARKNFVPPVFLNIVFIEGFELPLRRGQLEFRRREQQGEAEQGGQGEFQFHGSFSGGVTLTMRFEVTIRTERPSGWG